MNERQKSWSDVELGLEIEEEMMSEGRSESDIVVEVEADEPPEFTRLRKADLAVVEAAHRVRGRFTGGRP